MHGLVLRLHVLPEVKLVCEALAALVAVEGPLACVFARVCLQTGQLGYAPGAGLARVGLGVRGRGGGCRELQADGTGEELALPGELLAVRGQAGGHEGEAVQGEELALVGLLTLVWVRMWVRMCARACC